jgi:hypothetical protein
MIHLASKRTPGHSMLGGRDYNFDPSVSQERTQTTAHNCFIGPDYESNKSGLLGMINTGDVPVQRLAEVCLGRLAQDREDTEVVERLSKLLGSKNGGVKVASMAALGTAAQSSRDDRLAEICFGATTAHEISRAAFETIGNLYCGSGPSDVYACLLDLTRSIRRHPAKRRANRTLTACYHAIGMVFRATGSLDPLPFLLDVVSLPRGQGYDVYRRAAA